MPVSRSNLAAMVGVSWMSVLRWEHDRRPVPTEKLTLVAELYGRPLRWFLTLDEVELATSTLVNDFARRIYDRVSRAPLSAQLAVERAVDDMFRELELNGQG